MRRKSLFPEAFPISYQEQGQSPWCFWQGWSSRQMQWELGNIVVAKGGPPALPRQRCAPAGAVVPSALPDAAVRSSARGVLLRGPNPGGAAQGTAGQAPLPHKSP